MKWTWKITINLHSPRPWLMKLYFFNNQDIARKNPPPSIMKTIALIPLVTRIRWNPNSSRHYLKWHSFFNHQDQREIIHYLISNQDNKRRNYTLQISRPYISSYTKQDHNRWNFTFFNIQDFAKMALLFQYQDHFRNHFSSQLRPWQLPILINKVRYTLTLS